MGVDQRTVGRWFEGNNRQSPNTSVPDARVKVPPKQRPLLAERIESGEKAEQVAADYGITTRPEMLLFVTYDGFQNVGFCP